MSENQVTNWKSPRARIGALSRSRRADDPELLSARRDLRAARLACFIQETVDAAPPLTSEQRDRLATLLRPNPLLATSNAGGHDAA